MPNSAVPSSKEIWIEIRKEAFAIMMQEPLLRSLMQAAILDNRSFGEALAKVLSALLATHFIRQPDLERLCLEVYSRHPEILEDAACDLHAVCSRDPATHTYITPFMYLKGVHALEAWRVAHALWNDGRREVARFMQSVISDRFAVDIHPAALIGRGIMFDHATGLVIGETASVGDNVSILQGVTLGGTGKDEGDRHPKVASGVMIGAGSKVLGNIKVGEGAKIGAGSVVLSDVPPHVTVVGVPARQVGHPRENMPSLNMDQQIDSN